MLARRVQIGMQTAGHLVEQGGEGRLANLPANAQAYVRYLEEMSGAPISAIGVGQDRDATIVVRDMLA